MTTATMERPLNKTRHITVPPPTDKRPIQEIWIAYKKRPTKRLRNRLVENYLPLVKYQAEMIHRKLPDNVDVEDLMSAGIFGLMRAIERFDLERGVKFETFCAPRIRGAILDEMRANDWVPRLTRKRSKQISIARRILFAKLGRQPTDKEVRGYLGLSEAEYTKILGDSSPVRLTSLSRKWFETDSEKDFCQIDSIENPHCEDPAIRAIRTEVREAILSLSPDQRYVVVEYYLVGQRKMKEIGEDLGLSESRICQILRDALLALRHRLPEHVRNFFSVLRPDLFKH